MSLSLCIHISYTNMYDCVCMFTDLLACGLLYDALNESDAIASNREVYQSRNEAFVT
jgi:hypothetical protein